MKSLFFLIVMAVFLMCAIESGYTETDEEMVKGELIQIVQTVLDNHAKGSLGGIMQHISPNIRYDNGVELVGYDGFKADKIEELKTIKTKTSMSFHNVKMPKFILEDNLAKTSVSFDVMGFDPEIQEMINATYHQEIFLAKEDGIWKIVVWQNPGEMSDLP